jgi:hypothetical protein
MLPKSCHCSLKKQKAICAHLHLFMNKKMFSQVACPSKFLLSQSLPISLGMQYSEIGACKQCADQ